MTRSDATPPGNAFVRSPDGKLEAFVRGFNVYVRPVGGGPEVQLTTDGANLYSYGTPAPSPSAIRDRLAASHLAVVARLAKDRDRSA
ncbi:MAG: DPP IV N-terminal domain-containing protein [Gemmatimonadaceae bacterium]